MRALLQYAKHTSLKEVDFFKVGELKIGVQDVRFLLS